MMSMKSFLRTSIKVLYRTFKLIRCDDCEWIKPAFNFPIMYFYGESVCRKCYNNFWLYDEVEKRDYRIKFSPLQDIWWHFIHELREAQQ